ncbi:MAG: J domain-containing protein [Methanoregula sp.]|jgi:hypothetical protein|nr:J domain-containing protein [Methanoregula sp.]
MTTRSTLTRPEVAEVFGIHGRASVNGIHTRFRELVKVWHPIVSQHDPGLSHDVLIRINEAYDIVAEYGMNYDVLFRVEDIQKGTDYTPGEFRMIHCGDDPIWG